jgi:hypothetical protein
LSSFGATSLLRSQSGFRGAKLIKSNSLITSPWFSLEISSLIRSETSPAFASGTTSSFKASDSG